MGGGDTATWGVWIGICTQPLLTPHPPPQRDPPSPELQLYSQVSAGLWPGVGGPALRAEAGRGPGFQGIEWLYPAPFLSRESSLHGREGEERPPACSC